MIKIINGKRYDTTTAIAIDSYWNGLSTRDFGYVDETLYIKRTGEFFLHGVGGAASKYAKSCGDRTYCGGEGIIPLTESEARAWVESHSDAEKYEETFGEADE